MMDSLLTSVEMISIALPLIFLKLTFYYWDLQDRQIHGIPVNFCSNEQCFSLTHLLVVYSLLLGLAIG